LPEKVTPEQAQEFTTILGRFEDEISMELDLNKTLASAVRRGAKNDELPLDVDETKQLLRLLRKLGPQMQDLAPEATKQLKRKARTKDQTTVQWTGGGGVTVAKLTPVRVDVIQDEFSGFHFLALTKAASRKDM